MTTVCSAKVTGGVIVADDLDLPEGATVTVVVDEPVDDYAELTAEEAAELAVAIAAADRGEGVPWETVRDQLRLATAPSCGRGLLEVLPGERPRCREAPRVMPDTDDGRANLGRTSDGL